MPRDDNSSLRNDCSSLGGTKDFSGEGPGSTCGTKVRYEPHTIQAELRKDRKGKKEFHIRGVFRMDSRFDPTCKPIPDTRSKSRRKSTVGTDDGGEEECGQKLAVGDRQLTSKQAQLMIIDQRKNKIENRYSSPYAKKFQQKEK